MNCIILLLFSMCQEVRAQPNPDAPWSDVFNLPGADGSVTVFAEFAGKLIVSGDFTKIGRFEIPLETASQRESESIGNEIRRITER